ncbi:hypothetical protein LB553_24180 [Mesorhizobium sp. CA8]|uniref:hypothetical protein n=1 Tax=unclassified Mesorhizobium TaxID=325217 RepID=UPI001CCFABF0|nr:MULTISPECIES: hypothetical protein [unclassified Mesorhizobium]MBZ9763960.1 hypothetical protein [Mesorhizobium sp. CA8]MBZ9822181.1 hypothetical protein [Mesorhizobium sp. CA4]
MAKLTKRTVGTTEIRSADYVIWDEELPGFGLRVFASGRKATSCNTVLQAGRVASHRPALGRS